jgi:hypothetical protein
MAPSANVHLHNIQGQSTGCSLLFLLLSEFEFKIPDPAVEKKESKKASNWQLAVESRGYGAV